MQAFKFCSAMPQSPNKALRRTAIPLRSIVVSELGHSASSGTIVEEDAIMPVLSRFLGIVIAMYSNDHSPPHFHAKYGEYEITVEILTGVVEGKFPKRALRHVLEWSELHKDELIADWGLCQWNEEPKPIEPLE